MDEPQVDPAEKAAQESRMTFGLEFTKGYYATFDGNRQDLSQLYRPQSRLTFESKMYRGPEQILNKLLNLPFASIVHQVNTLDVQEATAGIIILVTGALLVDDEKRPINFTQAFTIGHDQQYYVHNDIFRLVYG